MENVYSFHYLEQSAGALAKFVLIALVLPLLPVVLLDQSPAATLALMTGTFVIEYGAAPVGIGLGLNPIAVLWVLACIALGVTLFLFDIFDMAGRYSKRVARFLHKANERKKRSGILTKYGIYGLIPCVMVLGFYICPPVAWAFGWSRKTSVIMIMTGYIAVSVVTMLLSLGILDLLAG